MGSLLDKDSSGGDGKVPDGKGVESIESWFDIDEKDLEWIPVPEFILQDPFVKHKDKLPSALPTAIVSTVAAGALTLMVMRWNRQAGTQSVARWIRKAEQAQKRGKRLAKPEQLKQSGALLGFKALGIGTLLCGTYGLSIGSWTAHFLKLGSVRDLGQVFERLLKPVGNSLRNSMDGVGDAISEQVKLPVEYTGSVAKEGAGGGDSKGISGGVGEDNGNES